MSVAGPDQVNPERQLTDRQKQAQQEMTQGVVKTLTLLIYTIRTPIGGSVRPHQVQPPPLGVLHLPIPRPLSPPFSSPGHLTTAHPLALACVANRNSQGCDCPWSRCVMPTMPLWSIQWLADNSYKPGLQTKHPNVCVPYVSAPQQLQNRLRR